MAGIIVAVKSGRVDNSAWGRRMHGRRGGKVMARWGLPHLKAIAPLGSQAAAAKRQQTKAQQNAKEALPQLGEPAGTMPWTGETDVYWPKGLSLGHPSLAHSATRRVRMRDINLHPSCVGRYRLVVRDASRTARDSPHTSCAFWCVASPARDGCLEVLSGLRVTPGPPCTPCQRGGTTPRRARCRWYRAVAAQGAKPCSR
jgi:hypothetical protein